MMVYQSAKSLNLLSQGAKPRAFHSQKINQMKLTYPLIVVYICYKLEPSSSNKEREARLLKWISESQPNAYFQVENTGPKMQYVLKACRSVEQYLARAMIR